jgi:hypothetical protein
MSSVGAKDAESGGRFGVHFTHMYSTVSPQMSAQVPLKKLGTRRKSVLADLFLLPSQLQFNR